MIELTKKASKEFSCLDSIFKVKIAEAIDSFVNFTEISNVNKLKTLFPCFRIKNAVYRILFTINKKVITI